MNCKPSIAALQIRIFGVLLLLVSLPLLGEVGGTGASEAAGRVAVVGKKAITEKDISCKIQIEKAYGNERATREAALISLVNDAIEHEMATLYGVTITREEIDAFKRYVDEHTKAPEILQKVKTIFADAPSSYERTYLAPKMINRKLRYFYARSPEIHEKERGLIERAYGLVVSGKSFQEAADERGLKSSAFEIEDKGTVIHPELQNIMGEKSSAGEDPLIQVLESLAPGEICRNIVEDDFGYRVIRLSGKSGDMFLVEAISVDKRPFDAWLREEASTLGIEILDQALGDKIRIKYPDLWWLKMCSKQ